MTLHYSLIAVYANPFSSQKTKARVYASAYVYPYFQQSWNLFAPAPTCNYSLFALYQGGKEHRPDIFNEILTLHQANRLAGYEPLVLAFSNSIHYFEKNSPLQNAINGPIQNDAYFDVISYAAKNYISDTRRIEVGKIKLVLVVSDVLSGKSRVYFD